MKEIIKLEKKIAGKNAIKTFYAVRRELSVLNLSGAVIAERNGDGDGWTLVHTTKRGYKSLAIEALLRAGLSADSSLLRTFGGVFCQGEAARLARLISFSVRGDNGKRKIYVSCDTVRSAHERALLMSGDDDAVRAYNARLVSDPAFRFAEWSAAQAREHKRMERARRRMDYAAEKAVEASMDC